MGQSLWAATVLALALTLSGIAGAASGIGNDWSGVEPGAENASAAVSVFSDWFNTTTLNTARWPTADRNSTTPTITSANGISNPPSSPYGLLLNGVGDVVTSQNMALTTYATGVLRFHYEQGGTGDDPEAGEDLVVKWYLSSLTWYEAFRANGSDPASTSFNEIVINLPPQAFHPAFRFKMEIEGGNASQDNWFLDNIMVMAYVGPPTVTVTAPDGGEVWCATEPRTISWTASGGTGTLTISIEYSTAGGSGPWTQITAGLGNSGSYSWAVANAPSTNARIRITATDSSSQSGSDISDADFEIKRCALTVTVLGPNGGEALNASEWYIITWDFSGGIRPIDFDLHYSVNGSNGPWSVIKTGTGQTTSHTWNPIPIVQTTDGYVRVTARDSSSNVATDTNNAAFSVTMPPAPTFHVQAPNGGENYTDGDVVDIRWITLGSNRFNRVNVSWSNTGASGPWTLLTNSIPNLGAYAWTAPNQPTTNAYAKIHAQDNFGRYAEDVSNGSFAIKPKPFTVFVNKPQSSAPLIIGQQQQIEWFVTGGTGPFSADIDFSSTGLSGPWTSVAKGVSGNVHQWTVPATVTVDGYIRVSVTDTSSSSKVQDVNDAAFTISRPKPVVQVIGPNGGERLMVLTSATVQWTGSGGSGPLTYDVAYSTTGVGGPWTDIVTGVAAASTQWLVPSATSKNAFVRVKATDTFETSEDFSNAAFEIAAPSTSFSVSVSSPSGGESWRVLEPHDIGWKSVGTGPFKVDLHFSKSGAGGPWTEVALDIDDSGSHPWTVPLLDRTYINCYVRATLKKTSTGENATAINPRAFTISRPPNLAGVTGKVVDLDSKDPLETVEVRLVNTAHSGSTDENGYFALTDVLPGKYSIEASLANYDLYRGEIEIPADQIVEFDIELVSQFSPSKGRQNIGTLLVQMAPWLIVILIVIVAAVGYALTRKRRARVKAGSCGNCGMPVPGSQPLCARCAAGSNQRVCPKCRNLLPIESGWCNKCGSDISTLAPSAYPERAVPGGQRPAGPAPAPLPPGIAGPPPTGR